MEIGGETGRLASLAVVVSDSRQTLVVLVALALKCCVFGRTGATIHQLIEGECVIGCICCCTLLFFELNFELLSLHKNLLIRGQAVLIGLLASGAQIVQSSV